MNDRASSRFYFDFGSNSVLRYPPAAKLVRYFAYAAPTPSHLPEQSVFGAASSGACRALLQYISKDQFALDQRADVSSATPLMYAVQFEQDKSVELLLDKGACVNLKDSSGKTALQYAAASWNVGVVQLLVAAKACVLSVDKDKRTCLHAAACGRQRCLELLASRTQLQQPTVLVESNNQVLLRARETTQILAASNQALVNVKDKDGRCALHFAASNARSSNVSVGIVRTLLECKASPNCYDFDRMTPLHTLCEIKNYKDLNKTSALAAVQLLLQAKADLCALNTEADTPLNVAARTGDVDLVAILLNGAHDAAYAVEYEFPVHDALAAGSAQAAVLIANATPNPLWTAEKARPHVTTAEKSSASPIDYAANEATRLEFRSFLANKYKAHFAMLIQHTARTKQKLPIDVLGDVAAMLLPPR